MSHPRQTDLHPEVNSKETGDLQPPLSSHHLQSDLLHSRDLLILTLITHPGNNFLLQSNKVGRVSQLRSREVVSSQTTRNYWEGFCDRMWGKRNPYSLLLGMQTSKGHYGNQYGFFSKKIEDRINIGPRSTCPGHQLTKHLNFLARCYNIHNSKDWGQPSPPLDERTMKTYSHTIEFYSAVKETEICNLQENA